MQNKLFLLFCFIFFTNLSWAVNSLCVTSIGPSSTVALANGENITIEFDYIIDEPGGARIFIRPFTNGALTPGYGASGSIIYSGSGSSSARFTISSGTQTVDELRVRITTADQSTELFEYFIPTQIYFGPNAAYLNDIPYQASFLIGENADVPLSYNVSEAGGTRIFVRPFSNGSLTPNYGASGSPNFTGTGMANAPFTISSGLNVLVDSLRIQILNDDQSNLLLEYFVPVKWYFSTVKVTDIAPGNDGDTFLNNGDQINTSLNYETTDPGGIRIFIRPLSDGNLTQSYAASGSPIFNASGSMSGNFTITEGNAMVDQLIIRCTNADQSQTLLEYFVPVHYAFGSAYVSPLTYCPDSPARLKNNDRVNIIFSHDINVPGGTRIFIRPFTNGDLSPGYGASGSPNFSGTGTDTVFFTISSGDVVVDALRVRITNNDQSETLLEYFEPVHFVFGENTSVAIEGELEQGWEISNPFPNPFANEAKIHFTLDNTQSIHIDIVNVTGQNVRTLFNGMVPANVKQELNIQAQNLPKGLYFVRFKGQDIQASRPIVLR